MTGAAAKLTGRFFLVQAVLRLGHSLFISRRRSRGLRGEFAPLKLMSQGVNDNGHGMVA